MKQIFSVVLILVLFIACARTEIREENRVIGSTQFNDYPTAPLPTAMIVQVKFIALNDGRQSSFGILNPWIVMREDVSLKNTSLNSNGLAIILQSDHAIDYICRRKGCLFDDNSYWHATFYDKNMKMLTQRRFDRSLLKHIPDLDKAMDNNGMLLLKSCPIFYRDWELKKD